MRRKMETQLLERIGSVVRAVRNVAKAMEPREITPEIRQRFERCAPAALARRSSAYLSSVAVNSLQWVVLGAIGLLGLFLWKWPPLDFVLLLLVACVAGILVDTLRWMLARKALIEQVGRHNDDMFVWAIVGASRHGSTHADAGNLAPYRAGIGVLLDWILGGLALLILGRAFIGVWPELVAYVEASRGLPLALIAAVVLPLVSGLISLWSWRSAGATGTVLEFGAGARGVFLLALSVAVFLARESAANFFNLIVFFNGATLVLGLFALLGLVVMRNDAAWLRQHLREAPRQTS